MQGLKVSGIEDRLGQVLRNYWGVLSHRGAMGYVLCGALSSSGMFAFLSASPYVYIEYFKVPTEHYGWLFGLNILLMMVVTFVNSRLVKGVGAERMLQYGLLVLPCAGALLVYNAWSQTGGGDSKSAIAAIDKLKERGANGSPSTSVTRAVILSTPRRVTLAPVDWPRRGTSVITISSPEASGLPLKSGDN